jgi:hypothetical protein
MGIFLAISVAANFAVMFSVVDNAVKTTVSHTGYLEVKGSDKIVQTAEATETLPMFVAPVLPFEQLAATKVIKVKYAQAGGLVETQMAVAGVRRHNSTFVEFITTVPGEVVRTLNGEAHLIKNPTFANQLTEPQLFPICAADTECSAFTTEKTDADALTTMAVDELAKAGFGSYQEDHRRGLHSMCGPYHCHQVGSWVTFSEVFNSADGSGRVKDVKVRFYDQPTGAIQHVVYLLHGMGGTGAQIYTAVSATFDQPEYINFVFVYPTSSADFGGIATWNSYAMTDGAWGYNIAGFPQITSLYRWLSGDDNSAYTAGQSGYQEAIASCSGSGCAGNGGSTSWSYSQVSGSYSPSGPPAAFGNITITARNLHPATASLYNPGNSNCYSRQLAIGWSDGGRCAIQMNLFNRDTGIDSAVGIAGHPYFFQWSTPIFGLEYFENLHEMAASRATPSTTTA